MKMELTENGCLKIMLTEEDLNRLGLSFASLDYDLPATRSALQTLLMAARNETGFDPAGGLVVEAVPVDGGCLLLFTPTGNHRRIRLKKAVGPYIYEVEDAEQLFRLAEGLTRYRQPLEKRLLPSAGSSLYLFGEKYRLILYPAAALPRGVQDLMREFSRSAGEGDAAAAFTAEHGRAIAIGDALLRLCSAAQGNQQS